MGIFVKGMGGIGICLRSHVVLSQLRDTRTSSRSL